MNNIIKTFIFIIFAAAALTAPGGTAATSVDYGWLAANAGIVISPIDGQAYYKLDDMLFAVPAKAPEGIENSCTINQITLWPTSTIHYTFTGGGLIKNPISEDKRSIFRQAAAEWTKGGIFTFIENDETTYVIAVIESSENCGSLGLDSALVATLGIHDWNVGTVAHEIGHNLGLFHEHQRQDRDQYITINWDNISSGAGNKGQFYVIDEYHQVPLLTGYDFLSIMHYSRWGFSANGEDTITCNAGYERYQDAIGQRAMLTVLDRIGIAKLYGKTEPAACSFSASVSDASMGSIRAGSPLGYNQADATLITQVCVGVPLTLTAKPSAPTPGEASLYEFESWEINGAYCSDASTGTVEITPSGDCSVMARFKPAAPIHTVTFTAGAGGSLEGTLVQKVREGSSTTRVAAIPDEGLQFTGWTGSLTSKDNPVVVGPVGSDMTLTASFGRTRLHAAEGSRLTMESTVALGGSDLVFSLRQTPSLSGAARSTLKTVSNNGWTLVFDVRKAPLAGAYPVSVKRAGGPAVPTAYSVEIMPPSITSATLSQGNVIVEGSWFGSSPVFTVDGKRARATSSMSNDGASRATVLIPKNSSPTLLAVRNSSGSASCEVSK